MNGLRWIFDTSMFSFLVERFQTEFSISPFEEQWYIGFKLCLAPTINHLERKRAMYRRNGMSKREIQKDIVRLLLFSFWLSLGTFISPSTAFYPDRKGLESNCKLEICIGTETYPRTNDATAVTIQKETDIYSFIDIFCRARESWSWSMSSIVRIRMWGWSRRPESELEPSTDYE